MITINQSQYIGKILRCFELGNACPVSTLMALNIKLPKLEAPEIDQQLYQSMLGSLMYAATGMRPGIMFAVHYLSQFSIALGLDHLITMKQVYWYLNGTQDFGITFYGNWIWENLTGFTNSDWAGDSNSQRSIAGYAFIFCGAVMAWLAKKQLTIALSSTEVEYMALTHAGKEVVFLDHLFNDIGISHSTPITLLIDNQSAIALAENPIFHARSKHIEV